MASVVYTNAMPQDQRLRVVNELATLWGTLVLLDTALNHPSASVMTSNLWLRLEEMLGARAEVASKTPPNKDGSLENSCRE